MIFILSTTIQLLLQTPSVPDTMTFHHNRKLSKAIKQNKPPYILALKDLLGHSNTKAANRKVTPIRFKMKVCNTVEFLVLNVETGQWWPLLNIAK